MTTIRELADDAVATFRPRPTVDWPFLTLADETAAADIPYPIQTSLAVRTWTDAAALAEAAAKGEPMATDNQAFRFRRDGSVVISDPLGDAVSVSETAFRALLVRLLDVLVDIAERRGDPVTGSAEWSVLAAAREQLRGDGTT
jgi:hypothetical protein